MRISTGLTFALLVALAAGCAPRQPWTPPPIPPSDQPPPPPGPQQPPPPESAETQVGVQGDAYADTDPSALTDFHAALDPHGSWVDDPDYGMVWVPNPGEVGADFTPYVSGGHWAYGDDYVWTSDWDWGWAPFHYGRWVPLGGGGWGWIPGREYSGGWVTWRMGDDSYPYLGWGPMAPAFYWRGGVAVEFGSPRPPPPFVFVGRGDVFSPTIRGRVIVGERARGMEAHTQPYVAGGGSGGAIGHAGMHTAGPPPSKLGISASAVPHPNPQDKSVARAQQFAHPSTAQAVGGHPPSAHVVRTASSQTVSPLQASRENTQRVTPTATHAGPTTQTTTPLQASHERTGSEAPRPTQTVAPQQAARESTPNAAAHPVTQQQPATAPRPTTRPAPKKGR